MRKHAISFLTAAFVLGLASAWSRAEGMDDDSKVQAEAQRIDKVSATDDQKVDALADQFKVPDSAVNDLRAKGQGWGEVSIGLGMAQQLMKSDPKTYPTMADALNKVESLRAAGEGWGKIAKDLGFKLGPVVSAAHHVRHEMMVHPDHPVHAEGVAEHMPNHPDHPEHMDHLDRPGR